MIGDVAIFGVFVPTLLLIGCVALVLCGLLTTVLSTAGFYRLIAYRPIVDLALFLLLYAALVQISGISGPLS